MRLPVLSSDEMTSEQVDLYREILGGPRGQGPRAVLLASGAGGLAGPFNAMLYAPPVGHALQELGMELGRRWTSLEQLGDFFEEADGTLGAGLLRGRHAGRGGWGIQGVGPFSGSGLPWRAAAIGREGRKRKGQESIG